MHDVINLKVDAGLILMGYGNTFIIESMWEGKYNYEHLQRTEFGYEASKPLLLFVDFLIKKFCLPPLGANPCVKDRSDPKRWVIE